MLRPSIARKVLRVRSARLGYRGLHAHLLNISCSPLPSEHPSEPPIATRFPLYRREEFQREPPITQAMIDSLPTDEGLSRQLKRKVTKKAVEDIPEWSEEDLRAFYLDLVKTGVKEGESLEAIKAPENQVELLSDEQRRSTLAKMSSRLLGQGQGQGHSNEASSLPPVHRGKVSFARLPYAILESLAPLAILSGPSETSKGKAVEDVAARLDVPLGLVSNTEWSALFQELIQRQDAVAAEAVLDLMNAHGMPVDSHLIDEIMHVHAMQGRPDEVKRLVLEVAAAGDAILPVHQDKIVLSLLQQSPSDARPAIAHLLQAEEAATPFPQSSYQLAISHLTTPSPDVHPNAHTRSLAWDLFAHMRLKAHPTPTREMYATMIRSCGDANQPQPERARDLWLEMTQQERMEPNGEGYNAIIRALGSTKKDYLEAFDLLRQMLVKHNDATFVPFEDDNGIPRFSKFVPTLETFNAVMEGAKRAGDINRARWVLTEVLKLSRAGQALQVAVWKDGADESLLSAVFMTYAAWKPVVKKQGLKLRTGGEAESGDAAAEAAVDDASKEAAHLDVDVLQDVEDVVTQEPLMDELTLDEPPVSTPTTPLSSADALRECTSLFKRILSDNEAVREGSNDFLPFKSVRLSPRLINSYLSVHLVHGTSLIGLKKVHDEAWQDAAKTSMSSVEPNGWSYMFLLEKCSSGARVISPAERPLAVSWGRELWSSYLSFYSTASSYLERNYTAEHPLAKARKRWIMGLGDRQVERVWKAAIKLESVHGDVDQALKILEDFVRRFPAEEISRSYKPIPEAGLSIRMALPSATPEADVPPLLLFSDVQALHQRLVKEKRFGSVRRLKWVVEGYTGALAKRRKWRMKGVAQGRERMAEKRHRRGTYGAVEGEHSEELN
ncbi:hypothetical protein I350_01181 [Cryptococcus amylolentus CBS 6273]|uniref:Pentatricopeptide repeat domain-containing protein n=1 Tax=Cryptococcus amylolentus CBS 6273 TaxID=1296118 RepID=A0A1E3KBW3_9TREE|nr:hypothetical protein I350_01181 [Cryptococcus amylolentus CBS 6273]